MRCFAPARSNGGQTHCSPEVRSSQWQPRVLNTYFVVIQIYRFLAGIGPRIYAPRPVFDSTSPGADPGPRPFGPCSVSVLSGGGNKFTTLGLESERRGPRMRAHRPSRGARGLLPLAEGALAVARQQFLVEGEQLLIEGAVVVPKVLLQLRPGRASCALNPQPWTKSGIRQQG